jgi:hypothetical protein
MRFNLLLSQSSSSGLQFYLARCDVWLFRCLKRQLEGPTFAGSIAPMDPVNQIWIKNHFARLPDVFREWKRKHRKCGDRKAKHLESDWIWFLYSCSDENFIAHMNSCNCCIWNQERQVDWPGTESSANILWILVTFSMWRLPLESSPSLCSPIPKQWIHYWIFLRAIAPCPFTASDSKVLLWLERTLSSRKRITLCAFIKTNHRECWSNPAIILCINDERRQVSPVKIQSQRSIYPSCLECQKPELNPTRYPRKKLPSPCLETLDGAISEESGTCRIYRSEYC